MKNGPFLVVLVCYSHLLVIQILLPKTEAVRITPNADGFMIENHRSRTRTRQNYMVQRALEDELSANLDSVAPVSADGDAEISPEELSSQIVDYANMIRNDVIFLDNSVETTTRKRANIKKKNHAVVDHHCSCESEKEMIDLGENFYPRRLESWRCLEGSCALSFRCKPTYYWITVLKRASLPRQEPLLEMPRDLQMRWETHHINVTAACVCATDFIHLNQ